jgi:hypothetical protein
MRVLLLLAFVPLQLSAIAQELPWQLHPSGGIYRQVQTGRSFSDHIEMSGQKISVILRYGADSTGRPVWNKQLVFPLLRTLPNDTRGSLKTMVPGSILDSVRINGRPCTEKLLSFYLDGYIAAESTAPGGIRISRRAFPSTGQAAWIETYRFTNQGTAPVTVHIPAAERDIQTAARKGADGAYIISSRVYQPADTTLQPGQWYTFTEVTSGRRQREPLPYISAAYEWEKRAAFLQSLQSSLVLQTPNDTLNRMFAFAKIRATESIFATKGGLMHGPGGGDYYAAIWANDQAEYIGPFFPFLGNAEGNESARNCYRLFATYMNTAYRPIPSSIIAEGDSTWNGAGDRGDQAMIAYGAARFALLYADTAEANRLQPLISWCLEYLRRKKNAAGVIPSDADELEGRFPAGKINLSTNVLAYGAFRYAAALAASLGNTTAAAGLGQEAAALEQAIERYFGAKVQGYDTYRYYEGNDKLRSWICLPLVFGINNRKEQTIQALFSPYLWSRNGILTEAGSTVYWDRATLYAFRGLFTAGATDTSLKYFSYYSAQRLLGAHVPYAVEAWPEGNQRHLSAESGLYCRVVTEGLFGIDPISFNSFHLSPRLPAGWNTMSLQHMKAFGRDCSIKVQRAGKQTRVEVSCTGGRTQVFTWNGQAPLTVVL